MKESEQQTEDYSHPVETQFDKTVTLQKFMKEADQQTEKHSETVETQF